MAPRADRTAWVVPHGFSRQHLERLKHERRLDPVDEPGDHPLTEGLLEVGPDHEHDPVKASP